MTRFGLTKRRALIAAIPAAAILAGGSGVAVAATHGAGDHEQSERPAYHSSLTTSQKDGADEAGQARALARQAKIDLPQAGRAAARAVPGAALTEVELSNEGGNVVYLASVVGPHGELEVVIDAGNGHVLAKQAEHDNDSTEKSETGESGQTPTPGNSPATSKPGPSGPSTGGTPTSP